MKALVGTFNKEKALVGPFSRHCVTSRRLADSSTAGRRGGGMEGVNNLISAITASAWLPLSLLPAWQKLIWICNTWSLPCLRPAPRICIFIIDWCWRLFRLFVCAWTRLQFGSFAYNLYWAWLAWPPLLIWTPPLWGFAWKYIAYTHIYCRYQHHGTSAFCTETTDNIAATTGAHSCVQRPVSNQQISSQPPVSESPGQRARGRKFKFSDQNLSEATGHTGQPQPAPRSIIKIIFPEWFQYLYEYRDCLGLALSSFSASAW